MPLRRAILAWLELDSDADTPYLRTEAKRLLFIDGLRMLNECEIEVPEAVIQAVNIAHRTACDGDPARDAFSGEA